METPSEGTNERKPKHQDEPWFIVLNIDREAPPEAIKHAYRDLIQRYHPDKVANLGDKLRAVADDESKRINAAFSAAKEERGFV